MRTESLVMMPVLPNLELHRAGIGLVPTAGSDPEGSAIYIEVPGRGRAVRSCTCATSRRKTCRHLRQLSQSVAKLRQSLDGKSWEAFFSQTVWYRLAHLLFEARPLACSEVRVSQLELGSQGAGAAVDAAATLIRVTSKQGEEIAQYLDPSPRRLRFLERTGKAPKQDGFSDRAGLIERLALFQLRPDETEMNRRGIKTHRQAWEESFWYRLAYHCVRELGAAAGSFHPAIDESSGAFTLRFRAEGEPICQLTLPRARVHAVLKLLAGAFPDQEGLAIHPVPLQSLFRVTQTTELDLEVRRVIRTLQQGGEERFFEREDLDKFSYGRLVYLPELGILAELEGEGKARKFKAPQSMRLKRSQVPSFLREYGDALEQGAMILDEPLRDLKIFKEYDFVEVVADAEERSWYWLSLNYSFGNQAISLGDILKAKKEGLPYLETTQGWIDLASPAFRDLDRLADSYAGKGRDKRLRLSASELLRLQAAQEKPLRIGGPKRRAAILRQLVELRPSRAYTPPAGMVSELRPYQVIGVDWLRFLYENRLGGLLCDDMGLGKTHQAMALMLSLREQRGVDGAFLVVCPTTVISHWRNKIRDHAPGLRAVVYHGPERDLAQDLERGDVLVTSYGILRNDLDKLREVGLALVVFDEIQYLKNRDTLGYQAASQIVAEVKLGLTGTPIENTIGELKALFDLILPGYLGSDEAFAERYSRSAPDTDADADADADDRASRLGELRRLISPFVLRRLKSSVIEELPEKIEDVRTCALSDDQIKLYRDVIATRGAGLVDRIESADEPLPYIHIFAVLNHLKQICDHPALALRTLDEASDYASGKWDLYCEILRECLDSDLKVVVFTQYLGMIELFERHLAELGIASVTLTGASTHRGEIVDRFNQDGECRVFLGSLKAGGTGIDLVGGSVVIHYDRWWNAAREDQATDRVHRIGQRRAVQVFKLVTEGTLEEKIAGIIERKRQLMES
ncbi:MAG: DEAD/DEAH box helicase, partial [bacterium]|nr:DEAD/DEAH box helicase [bacterium]